jgi:hypothetical protein
MKSGLYSHAFREIDRLVMTLAWHCFGAGSFQAISLPVAAVSPTAMLH